MTEHSKPQIYKGMDKALASLIVLARVPAIQKSETEINATHTMAASRTR